MRTFNRLLMVVIACAIGCAAVIGSVEAVLLSAGRSPWLVDRSAWSGYFDGLTYDHSSITWVAVGAIALGVLVVIAQLAPRRVASYRLADDKRHVIDRSALVALLDRRARESGALAVATRLTRRRARMSATLASNADQSAFSSDVKGKTAAVLDTIGRGRPRVKISTRVDS